MLAGYFFSKFTRPRPQKSNGPTLSVVLDYRQPSILSQNGRLDTEGSPWASNSLHPLFLLRALKNRVAVNSVLSSSILVRLSRRTK